MAHTAGPWSLVSTQKDHDLNYFWHEIVAEGRNPHRNPDESAIAESFEIRSDGVFDPEGMANARLITAAPEMLEALLQYRDDLIHPPTGDSVDRRLERVRCLIAKATAT